MEFKGYKKSLIKKLVLKLGKEHQANLLEFFFIVIYSFKIRKLKI